MVSANAGWRNAPAVPGENGIDQAELLPASADLFIREIAGRIGGPQVAGDGLGPDPEIAGAHREPAASGAAAGNVPLFVLEPGHEGIGQVRPDGAERPSPSHSRS